MLQLYARVSQTWDADAFVVRLTMERKPSITSAEHEGLLLRGHEDLPIRGFRTVFAFREYEDTDEKSAIILPDPMSFLADGDILRVVPRTGEIAVLYRKSSPFNSVLVTEQCNSNCIMCSQPPKDANDEYLVDAFLAAIPLMSPDTAEIGITGGEPTLLGDRLFDLLRSFKEHLPATALHMLSNGRLFNYLSLAQQVGEIEHPDLMIGIPLYSDIASVHDFVVQAKGAFDQTIRGIMNLARCGVRVEVRIVLHRQTIERLPSLARFISRNLPFVDHVALMGLEMMGHVKMNLPAVWIDPVDYAKQLQLAVRDLECGHMNISIYNHQLCVLNRELWPYARKSISDWKNEYLPICDGCAVKNECGGFFASAKVRHSDYIKPVAAPQSDGAVVAN
jgi:His-Xaa-Ser system radical SAM maturase HxsC